MTDNLSSDDLIKNPDAEPAAIQRTINHNPNNNPLHGVTLEKILERLVKEFGWDGLGKKMKVRCFNTNPSIKSSLTFLRKTPWARKKVEDMFMALPTRYM